MGVIRKWLIITCPALVALCRSKLFRFFGGLQHVQTGQQESRSEISPIDAAIDCRRTSFDAEQRQGVRQLLVTPVPSAHRALHHQAGCQRPFFHGLRFCLLSRFARQRNRATWLQHFQIRLPRAATCRRQLESILAHSSLGCLYLCPTIMEAVNA